MNSRSPSGDSPVLRFPSNPEELVAEQWCKLHQLIDELSHIQGRLGTPLEQSDDYAHVRQLGHEIRNKLLLLQLWADTGLTKVLPPGRFDPAILDRIAFA
jgi:hypothetical protein